MAISLIMHAKKPRRSPLRLRFLTIALAISPQRNILRNLHHLFSYNSLECVINMAGDHKRLGTGSDAILKKYSFSCSDLARISKVEKY